MLVTQERTGQSMKLTTKQDLEAPIHYVWRALTDFHGWERLGMRHGAEVLRTDQTGGAAAPGMAWSVKYVHKGQSRQLALRLVELHEPTHLRGTVTSKMFAGDVAVELVELSPKRTRVMVATEATPQTLAARLVLQSMKLAKSRVQRRYDTRIAQYFEDIGRRYAREGR